MEMVDRKVMENRIGLKNNSVIQEEYANADVKVMRKYFIGANHWRESLNIIDIKQI